MNVHKQFADFFQEDEIKPFAYLLSKKLSSGHVCLNLEASNLEELKNELQESELVNKELDVNFLALSNLISVDSLIKKPFVLNKNKLYLNRYFQYETKVIENIKMLIHNEKKYRDRRFRFLLEQKEFIQNNLNDPNLVGGDAENDEKTDWQLAGAVVGFLNNFTIITGGPGTGKTTTVAKILALLYKENPDIKVALTAPTGKAAIRMLESLKANKNIEEYGILDKIEKLNASTIHRLLGYIPNSLYFKHHQGNYLDIDVLIVDEASMIDISLFSKLLSALDPEKRVILLGDKNQLASVEAGSILGDLCASQTTLNSCADELRDLINDLIKNEESKISINNVQENLHYSLLHEHIIELIKIHRFAENSAIKKISKAIIKGDNETVSDMLDHINENNAEVQIDQTYDETIFKKFVSQYEEYINKPIEESLQLFNKCRVLCAVREGETGIYKINKKIESYLKEKGLLKIDSEFYEYRPIIVTKNNKDLELFNGDIGIIKSDQNNIKRAYFLDNNTGALREDVLPELLVGCETVFAMTIHKSQGSEYDNVMIILPKNEDNPLLTRELLYTAITRAKEKVIIQGQKEVIITSINKQVQRVSGLTNRIQ